MRDKQSKAPPPFIWEHTKRAPPDESAALFFLPLTYDADSICNKASIDDLVAAYSVIDHMHAPPYEDDVYVLLMQLFTERGWKQKAFSLNTHLSKEVFYKVRNKKRGAKWETETMMAIIAGLGVCRHVALRILSAAVCPLDPVVVRKHRAYSYLIDKFEGRPIEDWNAFLKALELDPIAPDKAPI